VQEKVVWLQEKETRDRGCELAVTLQIAMVRAMVKQWTC